MRTIVVGLGNPLLGDDGIGWQVVEYIQQEQKSFNVLLEVDYICLSVGGLRLMEHLSGYDRAILIDAVNMGKLPLGSVYCLNLADLPDFSAGHTGSAHDTSLLTAIRFGKELGLPLPGEILVIGIESTQVYNFSEKMSEQVADAIPRAAIILLGLLNIEAPT